MDKKENLGISRLFQTDQILCYNTEGLPINCPDTGQDGETRGGKPWPEPRFIQTENTITDRMTGLNWLKNADPYGFPLAWSEAFEYIDEMNQNNQYGKSDWRLPDRDELYSLVSHARINPAIAGAALFSNVFNGYYWSATPCARHTDQAWCVHLGGGRMVKGMTHRGCMVWPIRGKRTGYEHGEERFEVFDRGILDRATGLYWMPRGDLTQRFVTWSDALSLIDRINRKNHLGYANWRLPNIRELSSLVDDTRHTPAMALPVDLKSIHSFYWSATTSVYNPSYAWTLYTRDGYIGVGYKADPEFSVWPVRTS